jgi:hypothetical protein
MIFLEKVQERVSDGHSQASNAAIAVTYIVNGDWLHCFG